uniref:Uncharacterized protein n=2 Tax=Wuchereria bancrofti TaxID=6293 RepID=A0A1I8EG73_WUCBA
MQRIRLWANIRSSVTVLPASENTSALNFNVETVANSLTIQIQCKRTKSIVQELIVSFDNLAKIDKNLNIHNLTDNH